MPNAEVGRWVAPESWADGILFLASAAARDLHGASIPVYGRNLGEGGNNGPSRSLSLPGVVWRCFEATVGYASSPLGFPSASLRGASRRLGTLRGPERSEGNRRTMGLRSQEATVGFEPTNEGFADPCLTTWRRRREKHSCQLPVASLQLLRRSGSTGNWEPETGNCAESGRWDSNPRPSPWQGDVLPLNHARVG